MSKPCFSSCSTMYKNALDVALTVCPDEGMFKKHHEQLTSGLAAWKLFQSQSSAFKAEASADDDDKELPEPGERTINYNRICFYKSSKSLIYRDLGVRNSEIPRLAWAWRPLRI